MTVTTVKKKIQAYPIVSAVTGFVLVMGLVMGSITAISDIDGLIVTESEAALAHEILNGRINVIVTQFKMEAQLSKCRWLSDKIDRISYEVYTLEKDAASPDFIQSKQRELRGVERDFNALGCAAVLA